MEGTSWLCAGSHSPGSLTHFCVCYGSSSMSVSLELSRSSSVSFSLRSRAHVCLFSRRSLTIPCVLVLLSVFVLPVLFWQSSVSCALCSPFTHTFMKMTRITAMNTDDSWVDVSSVRTHRVCVVVHSRRAGLNQLKTRCTEVDMWCSSSASHVHTELLSPSPQEQY